MRSFVYNTEQFLPITIDTAWDFFSSANNLALITPPELDFKILTNLDGKEITEGMLINYRVKPLLNIPLNWKTEIVKIEKPGMFTDRQLKGPYKMWEHTHYFIQKDNGVLMKDKVKYQLPFGIIGQVAHSMFVRKKIEHIFIYRKEILNKIFKDHGTNNY
ncbi:MAG: SRPBCC family protein [Bacteroidota bacterium]|jgi:ligand-binding SRPBCC domain-containing protein|nr:SRPBCC family protein [Bacteroidota bacterium]